MSWESDVTRPYVEALEARGIAHVLVGGRAFHEREEVEAIRAALTAIEWPDDELSVFATLRGPVLRDRRRRAARVGAPLSGAKPEIGFVRGELPPVSRAGASSTRTRRQRSRTSGRSLEALWLLQRLHRHRNYVQSPGFGARCSRVGPTAMASERTSGGVSGTLQELLAATRAHVGFALRTGGEQALANVLHIAELARQYEMGGGISFRGFVDELRVAADTAQASEAPILEEDSDGVRMMTVHKAKGLEFPIVILADLTCRLSRPDAGRWIDPDRQPLRAASSAAGRRPISCCTATKKPSATRRKAAARLRRRHACPRRARRANDRRRGVRRRLARSAHAGDLSVADWPSDSKPPGPGMPGVSLQGLSAHTSRRRSRQADDRRARDVCVRNRPDEPEPESRTRIPNPEPRTPIRVYSVVWWDPHVLALDADSGYGLRRDDLIAKDGETS